jgi:hypothetical protein
MIDVPETATALATPKLLRQLSATEGDAKLEEPAEVLRNDSKRGSLRETASLEPPRT